MFELLKVKDLIAYLQTQNPEANIMHMEDFGKWNDTPKHYFKTCKERKLESREHYKHWFKDEKDPVKLNELVEKEMQSEFEYCNDDDICYY